MTRLAWALLLLAPALAEEAVPDTLGKIVEEASRLGADARREFAASKEMAPSLARNERLSRTRQLLKQAIEQYRLAAGIAPDRAAGFESSAQDLRSMLFWCNKSFAVILPEPPPAPAAPPVPAPAPPPDDPPQGAPPAPEAPAPPLEPVPRRDLVERCGELSRLFESCETRRDRMERGEERIKSILVALDSLHASLNTYGSNWKYVQRCKVDREALLSEMRKQRVTVEGEARQRRELDAKLLESRAALEWEGDAFRPALEAWRRGQPEGSLSEGMVAYLNGVLGPKPSPTVTRVPEDARFAAPDDVPADEAKPLLALLDALSAAFAQQAELEERIRCKEAEAAQIGREAEFARTWLERPGAHGANEDEAAQRAIAQLKVQQGQAGAEALALHAKLEGALKRREELLARLAKLKPDRARLVESWRRKARGVPPLLHEALEKWTREALKPLPRP